MTKTRKTRITRENMEEKITLMPPEERAAARLEMLKLAFEIEDSTSQTMVHYIDTGSLQKVKADEHLENAKQKYVDANGSYWIPCAESDRRSEVVVMAGKVTLERVLKTAIALRDFVEA